MGRGDLLERLESSSVSSRRENTCWPCLIAMTSHYPRLACLSHPQSTTTRGVEKTPFLHCSVLCPVTGHKSIFNPPTPILSSHLIPVPHRPGTVLAAGVGENPWVMESKAGQRAEKNVTGQVPERTQGTPEGS